MAAKWNAIRKLLKPPFFLCYKSYIKVDICAQSKCKALSSTESIQSSFFLCCNDLQCHLNYILSRSNLIKLTQFNSYNTVKSELSLHENSHVGFTTMCYSSFLMRLKSMHQVSVHKGAGPEILKQDCVGFMEWKLI